MKLCLMLGGNEEGGLENHFIALANNIGDYLPKGEANEIIVFAHEKYRKRFRPEIVFQSIDLTKSRRNPLLMYRTVRLLKKYSPDIIHAHASKAAALLNNIRYFINCKMVVTIHSQKKNLSMYENFDYIIGVSRSVIDKIHNCHKSVIYNGIPDDFINKAYEKITRADLGIENDLPVLVSIGRLVKVKALDILLTAVKNIPCNVLIVGEGPENKRLLQQVKQLGIRHVYFSGFQNNIKGYLKLADLTVISSMREGFSYVVAESLFMNTAVVSTDVPVANEILPRSYIAEVGNSADLARAIELALSKQQDFTPCFEFARKNFTMSRMNEKIAIIYQKVVDNYINDSSLEQL